MIKNTGLLFIFSMLITGIFFYSPPAQAEENYRNPIKQAEEQATPKQGTGNATDSDTPEPAKTFTVTSIRKCYDRLGREDVLDIQRNFIKPYQECQRRLSLLLQKEQQQKAGETKAVPPEKPRNFLQVQKSPAPAAHPVKENPPERPPIVEDRDIRLR